LKSKSEYHLTNLQNNKRFLLTGCLVLLLFINHCAYFNTFYNAREYFEQAQKEYAKLEQDRLPSSLQNKFDTAIEKSNKVLTQYPDSKWADNAQYIIALSNYYKGNYTLAKKKIEEFISNYPGSELRPELEVWYGKTLWHLGDEELAIHQWKKTAQSIHNKELVAEIYFSMAELYQERATVDSALRYYRKITELKRGTSKSALAQFRIAEIYLDRNDIQKAITNLNRVSDFTPYPELRNRMQVLLIKIYRQSGKYEKARSIIHEKLNNPNNKDIFPALELELALIYLAEEDFEAAQSRLKQITENYKRTPESAEAYYHLGELNMLHFHDYQQAQTFYNKVPQEFTNSKYASEARWKSNNIKQYFQITNALDQLTPQVTAIKNELLSPAEKETAPDIPLDDEPEKLKEAVAEQSQQNTQTVDTVAVFEDYYRNLYELAELYYFNFGLIDSAITLLEDITHNSLYNPYISKAIYALSYIHKEQNMTEKSLFYKEVLADRFPESPYLEFIENKKISLPPNLQAAQTLYHQAENLIESRPDSAIDLFQAISKKYPKTIYAEKSLLSIAYLYRNKFFTYDETMKWYQTFLDSFPNSSYFKDIKQTYDQLKNIDTTTVTKMDTTTKKSESSDSNEAVKPTLKADQIVDDELPARPDTLQNKPVPPPFSPADSTQTPPPSRYENAPGIIRE